jgi:hypothetical protein
MDDHPWTHRVAAEELKREGKQVDPRDYVTVEMKLANAGTAVAVLARQGDAFVSSAAGRLDYAIGRNGWVRTTIETKELSDIAFACFTVPDERGIWPDPRPCRVEAVSKVFFLGPDYVPRPSLWSMKEPFEIPPGHIKVFRAAGGAR